MNREDVIRTLRSFNEWRRYIGPPGEGPKMPDQKEIGEAIDGAIKELSMLEIEGLDEAATEYAGFKIIGGLVDTNAKRGFIAGGEWLMKRMTDAAIEVRLSDSSYMIGAALKNKFPCIGWRDTVKLVVVKED